MPAMVDRARQALDLQAWQPMAETLAAPHAYGFRPTRRCADALDPCGKVLRQKTSATWLVEADIHGFFDHLDFSWGEAHSPRNQDVLSQWLRSGFIDHGVLSPPTAGVPQGGISSPGGSHLVLDGREAVGHGGPWPRRVHHIHDVRWADDFIVTANAREV